jgi:hypothetical protein
MCIVDLMVAPLSRMMKAVDDDFVVVVYLCLRQLVVQSKRQLMDFDAVAAVENVEDYDGIVVVAVVVAAAAVYCRHLREHSIEFVDYVDL